ncbi:hypothetical protein VTN96DRAFT_621 [Rasamsonia emersonii]
MDSSMNPGTPYYCNDHNNESLNESCRPPLNSETFFFIYPFLVLSSSPKVVPVVWSPEPCEEFVEQPSKHDDSLNHMDRIDLLR